MKEFSVSCFIIFHNSKNNIKKIYHSKYRKTEKGKTRVLANSL